MSFIAISTFWFSAKIFVIAFSSFDNVLAEVDTVSTFFIRLAGVGVFFVVFDFDPDFALATLDIGHFIDKKVGLIKKTKSVICLPLLVSVGLHGVSFRLVHFGTLQSLLGSIRI